MWYDDFEFKDGGCKDKYIIVLNTPLDLTMPYIFCLTTTNKTNKYNYTGCYYDHGYFMLQTNEKYFKDDTWLKYNEFYELSANDVLALWAQKKLIEHGEIKPDLTRSIINCALKSIDISEPRIDIIKKCLVKDKRLA